MPEDLPGRAAQGEIEAISTLLGARIDPITLVLWRSANTAVVLTPELLQAWLDTAEAQRPRSSRREEEMFANAVGNVIGRLVGVAVQTGEPWNALLTHPLFTAPVVSEPLEPRSGPWPEEGEEGSVFAEDLQARAAQGDIAAISTVLELVARPARAGREQGSVPVRLTPELLQAWLDTAEAQRPRSSRHEEKMFAHAVGHVAVCLVKLAAQTGEPWNQMLFHPLFMAPVISVPAKLPPESEGDITVWVEPDGLLPFLRSVAEQARCKPDDAARAKILKTVRRAIPRASLIQGIRAAGFLSFLQAIFQELRCSDKAARHTIRATFHRGRGGSPVSLMIFRDFERCVSWYMPGDLPPSVLWSLRSRDETALEWLVRPNSQGRSVNVIWSYEDGCWVRSVGPPL
ncbi:hypothetical protein QA802_00140 [Streptomyces sp. B21-105]|uniref:hypothetical protein n=1 Tax=Streptomyces sp. B21-105 TaxID=3039417 RepID=UPI002FF367A8